MRHIIITLLLITSAAALDQGGAEAAVARGWAALDASNTDHTKNVDAALAFTEALGYYAEAGDAETCRELQADVYWAKKRMSLDDIQAYLAGKGQPAVALVDEMKRVADADVAVGEADAYFARAEAFAKAHPADHLKVAIRYFEVASRFPGTQAAMDAQQRSLDEQVQAKAPAAVAKAGKPAAPVKAEPKGAKVKPITGNVITAEQAQSLIDNHAQMKDDWKKLPGATVAVPGNARITSKVVVKAGEKYLILPDPLGRWASFDYRGDVGRPKWVGYNIPAGALAWEVDGAAGSRSNTMMWTAPADGALIFQPNLGALGGKPADAIGVKVFKVTE